MKSKSSTSPPRGRASLEPRAWITIAWLAKLKVLAARAVAGLARLKVLTWGAAAGFARLKVLTWGAAAGLAMLAGSAMASLARKARLAGSAIAWLARKARLANLTIARLRGVGPAAVAWFAKLRARPVIAWLTLHVQSFVPVFAIALLVLSMGGTWRLAGAQPRTIAQEMEARAPPEPERPPKKSARELTGKLNLNTATEDQLMLLPTVGPAKAERIVTWRKKNGGFRRIADLRRVKGFGYKTFKRLEPFLDIKGETTLK